MPKTFGGFIGEQKIDSQRNDPYHDADLMLNTARACFHYTLRYRSIKKVYLPYYICDSMIDVMTKNNTPYEFYQINKALEISSEIPALNQHDCLLYVNYFGLKSQYINQLEKTYAQRLLIDNSQAFYQRPLMRSWSFNSARKFFGITDGACLFTPTRPNEQAEPLNLKNWPQAHYDATFLRARKDPSQQQYAYELFLRHEHQLNTDIQLISASSDRQLRKINHQQCINIRRQNFNHLHKQLEQLNLLTLDPLHSDDVPQYYPFMTKKHNRKSLIDRGLFVPCLWPEVANRCSPCSQSYRWEKHLADHLLPLPIDHRYNHDDMDEILIRLNNQ